MGLTLQEVLAGALVKLEDSNFQRFIEKLSDWEVREEYRNIPKDELTGKDPEHVAGLIVEYYKYAYGAEVTLAILEEIDGKKVLEELQRDLRELDIAGHGLGTAMYTGHPETSEPVQTQPQWQSTPAPSHQLDNPRAMVPPGLECLVEVEEVTLQGEAFFTRSEQTLFTIRQESECCGPAFNLRLQDPNHRDVVSLYENSWDYCCRRNSYLKITVLPECTIGFVKISRSSHTMSVSIQMKLGEPAFFAELPLFHLENTIEILNVNGSCPVARITTKGENKHSKVLFQFPMNMEATLKAVILAAFLYMRYQLNKLSSSRSPRGRRYSYRHNLHHTHDLLLELSERRRYSDENVYLFSYGMEDSDPSRIKRFVSLSPPASPTDIYYCLQESGVYAFEDKYFRDQPLQALTSLAQVKAGKETEEPQTSREKITVDNFRCKLCGEDQDLAEVVSSTVGSTYQLELEFPGLYRCQKTGIKFLVKGPVIIEFKIDSWSDYLKDIPDNSYEILGPLFNIQTSGEPNAVSAVYLPHYLCLKGFSDDPSLIKCAHFRDGNMTLETPTQIEPFYITLENPTFSCLGPLLPFRKKKTPIHGSVLIYFTILCKGDPDEEYRIHLYALPYSTNAEETLDNENKKFGFQRIKKPEHTTDTVYSKVKYLVTGHPGVSANPQALKFQSQPYQFTEIQLQEKDANIFLKLCEEMSEDPVWNVLLTQRDIKSITLLQSQLTIHEVAGAGPPPEHFVDRHREALIQRTSNISPVLDNLLSQRLLTQEQYDTLRSMTPHQEAMRQLYVYMTIWGHSDKETLYQAVKTCNEPLIRDLETKDIIQL